MISQRDIAKLSNRLYQEAIATVGKKDARRIPDAVIERDYALAWFLTELAAHPRLSTALAFKGGTALRRVHFGEYRFSEDLDFSLTRPLSLAESFADLRAIFDSLYARSGVEFKLDEATLSVHTHTDTFFLTYKGPLPKESSVKVDVSRDETIVFPLEMKPVLQTYPEYSDLPSDAPPLLVYAFHEIVVEKTLAITDGARREPRDLYDLWFIMKEQHVQHPEEVVEGLNRKLASRHGRADDVLAPRLERALPTLKKAWEQRLGAQVALLPGFDECFRDVRKLMNDFDKLRGKE
jgi:predicted nucleotidyltransferase component of viral defense system